jgi:hypothetical protein
MTLVFQAIYALKKASNPSAIPPSKVLNFDETGFGLVVLKGRPF